MIRRFLALALVPVVFLSITAPPVQGSECPYGLTPSKYGPNPSDVIFLNGPNEPASYVYVLAPDGKLHGPFAPWVNYYSDVAGQWYVCYTPDVYAWMDTYGIRPPQPTTTTTQPPATTTTTSTIADTPVVESPPSVPEPEPAPLPPKPRLATLVEWRGHLGVWLGDHFAC